MTDSNATTTRNVICDLTDYPDGEVTFELVTFFAAEGNEGFPQKTYSLTLDETGQGTQALPAPSSGAWLWKVHLPDSNKPLATLSAGADIQLTAWLSAALSTETANSLEDFFLLLTGGTMTGPITTASLTTAERDALTPAEGMVIYNETLTTIQFYQNGAWTSVSGGLASIVEDTTPQLGGNLDAQGNNITDLGDVTFKTGAQGGTLRTGTANADKFVLAAYDVNDGVYRTVVELDAGNDVVMQLIADYLKLEDAADPTKDVEFDISGATTGTATTLIFSQTANRNITFPDETGTALTDQAVGSTVQAHDAGLDDLAGLSPADGTIPVGDGANWVAESGATARESLGAADTAVHLVIAASDEDSDLAIATPAITFRMPHAMTLTEVRASVNTAPAGSAIQVDINEGGVSILSTEITIDAGDKTSEDATTPPVISDTALADDAEITIDIDAVGSSTAGTGLKVALIGTRP